MSETPNSISTFGRKRHAVAVALVKPGTGSIRVNGKPLDLIEPQVLRAKVEEPIYVLGPDRFRNLDIRVRVRGGGQCSQVYAIRQAISKGIMGYYQKFVDEVSKQEIRTALISWDRSLLVADPRRKEPKKFGGPSARARYQKSYR